MALRTDGGDKGRIWSRHLSRQLGRPGRLGAREGGGGGGGGGSLGLSFLHDDRPFILTMPLGGHQAQLLALFRHWRAPLALALMQSTDNAARRGITSHQRFSLVSGEGGAFLEAASLARPNSLRGPLVEDCECGETATQRGLVTMYGVEPRITKFEIGFPVRLSAPSHFRQQ